MTLYRAMRKQFKKNILLTLFAMISLTFSDSFAESTFDISHKNQHTSSSSQHVEDRNKNIYEGIIKNIRFSYIVTQLQTLCSDLTQKGFVGDYCSILYLFATVPAKKYAKAVYQINWTYYTKAKLLTIQFVGKQEKILFLQSNIEIANINKKALQLLVDPNNFSDLMHKLINNPDPIKGAYIKQASGSLMLNWFIQVSELQKHWGIFKNSQKILSKDNYQISLKIEAEILKFDQEIRLNINLNSKNNAGLLFEFQGIANQQLKILPLLVTSYPSARATHLNWPSLFKALSKDIYPELFSIRLVNESLLTDIAKLMIGYNNAYAFNILTLPMRAYLGHQASISGIALYIKVYKSLILFLNHPQSLRIVATPSGKIRSTTRYDWQHIVSILNLEKKIINSANELVVTDQKQNEKITFKQLAQQQAKQEELLLMELQKFLNIKLFINKQPYKYYIKKSL